MEWNQKGEREPAEINAMLKKYGLKKENIPIFVDCIEPKQGWLWIACHGGPKTDEELDIADTNEDTAKLHYLFTRPNFAAMKKCAWNNDLAVFEFYYRGKEFV
jgi:hypothetical protein